MFFFFLFLPVGMSREEVTKEQFVLRCAEDTKWAKGKEWREQGGEEGGFRWTQTNAEYGHIRGRGHSMRAETSTTFLLLSLFLSIPSIQLPFFSFLLFFFWKEKMKKIKLIGKWNKCYACVLVSWVYAWHQNHIYREILHFFSFFLGRNFKKGIHSGGKERRSWWAMDGLILLFLTNPFLLSVYSWIFSAVFSPLFLGMGFLMFWWFGTAMYIVTVKVCWFLLEIKAFLWEELKIACGFW